MSTRHKWVNIPFYRPDQPLSEDKVDKIFKVGGKTCHNKVTNGMYDEIGVKFSFE